MTERERGPARRIGFPVVMRLHDLDIEPIRAENARGRINQPEHEVYAHAEVRRHDHGGRARYFGEQAEHVGRETRCADDEGLARKITGAMREQRLQAAGGREVQHYVRGLHQLFRRLCRLDRSETVAGSITAARAFAVDAAAKLERA
jgi:hypothetical protein